MVKIGLLVRCSTNQQSTASQKDALLDYRKKQNYEVVEIYEDIGVRGKAKEKPS